jgi:hypothetical protein
MPAYEVAPAERLTPTQAGLDARSVVWYTSGMRGIWFHEYATPKVERTARRDTKRLRRHRGLPIEQVIWGELAQNAYLSQGWVPVKEEVDRNGFTKMTMRLDP